MTMRLRLTGTFVLVLGIFVFAGSALAGNGHGNGNGNDGASGNSGGAPGQVKKDAPPAAADTTSAATTTVADQSAAPSGGPRSGDAVAQTASRSRGEAASQGALGGARRVAELPFTGERLWIAVLAGLLLIGTGLALRQLRTVEAPVQSEHDGTDR